VSSISLFLGYDNHLFSYQCISLVESVS